MLTIEGKTFMNIQEAVQWLLDNNCIPFQCTANYLANTEIGLGTIVNPSPAKVRIGSLIFFADSKVSTVIGITENGFICSDKYNNLVDDVAYVTNVSINGSGHLITTMSDGQTIDAGLIKQVTSFSINGSQHLIATYNDGTTTDLGAIFSGNVNIAGNLTADSIIENMSGYSFTALSVNNLTIEPVYAGVVKNGNKLTIVLAVNLTRTDSVSDAGRIGRFNLPSNVMSKLYTTQIGNFHFLDNRSIPAWESYSSKVDCLSFIEKETFSIRITINNPNLLTANTKYYYRYEVTFLLSENLAS